LRSSAKMSSKRRSSSTGAIKGMARLPCGHS